MKKVILYIAMSLDGFIASKDNSVEWLDKYNNSGESFGYTKFYDSIDTVVLGNTTYAQFPDAYQEKECYVFSRTKKGKHKKSTYINSTPKEFLAKLSDQNKNIWLVGGANLTNQFLKENLIDEMIISIMPSFLGEGVRLFRDDNLELSFKLINSKSYDCGVVQVHYKKL
jgi:dihydrofolate reductase